MQHHFGDFQTFKEVKETVPCWTGASTGFPVLYGGRKVRHWDFVNESKPIHSGPLKLRLIRQTAREPSIYARGAWAPGGRQMRKVANPCHKLMFWRYTTPSPTPKLCYIIYEQPLSLFKRPIVIFQSRFRTYPVLHVHVQGIKLLSHFQVFNAI